MVLIDIVTRLRQQQEGMLRKGEFAFVNRTDIIELVAIVDTLRAERDEARREVCNLMHKTGFLNGDYADSRGWDCFKENGK
jgi:uncharacterized protein Yka (UPF0111/DUF47 family)